MENKQETNFTPAPWSYSPQIAERGFLAQVWGPDRKSLVIIDGLHERATDDARLISAAPELLEELIFCATTLSRLAPKYESSLSTKALEELAKRLSKAKAAIDKATKS